ncbi:MAG TPA: hypothetical protein VF228_01480 [Iamia sp.]
MKRLAKVLCAPLIAVCLAAVAVACQGAGAEDHGNWDSQHCGDRAEACMWRGAVDDSKQVGSSQRDSNFNNDFWNSTDDHINDDVKYVENTFSTLEVRAYRNNTYVNPSEWNPTSCVPGGDVYGPYTQTSPQGLSSFKSC